VYRKTGAFMNAPGVVDGLAAAYRFLAAFFFPPLAAFFAMLRIPPFLRVGCATGLSAPVFDCCRLARQPPLPEARAPGLKLPRVREASNLKRGGVVDTPLAGLPLLCGLFLCGLLRGLLRHFSSWSGGCSGLPTVNVL